MWLLQSSPGMLESSWTPDIPGTFPFLFSCLGFYWQEGEGACSQLSMECSGRGRSCLSFPVPKFHRWELSSPSETPSLCLLPSHSNSFGSAGQLWGCPSPATARMGPNPFLERLLEFQGRGERPAAARSCGDKPGKAWK